MATEFWGLEVKNGESLKVDLGEDKILRVSQAALGESKNKGNEPVYLYLTVNGQKLIMGTLNQEKFPHMSVEILLEKGFELSHSWKHGSVYFSGYKVDARNTDTDTDDYSDDGLPVAVDNEKPEPNANQAKPVTKKADTPKSVGKQVKFEMPNKEAKAKKDDDDSDEDSEDDMSFSDDSGDEEGKKTNVGGDEKVDSDDDDDDEDEDNDDDDESDDDSSDEETPKKPEPNKKRPAEASGPKMPASDKKAKFATPQKTEPKKSNVHVATPHPAKQTGKKPGSSEGSKQQTPKSGGSYQCKSCNRSFNSEVGLESHTKAKHA